MNKKTTMPRESWSFAQDLLPELSAVEKPTGCSTSSTADAPRPRSGSGPDAMRGVLGLVGKTATNPGPWREHQGIACWTSGIFRWTCPRHQPRQRTRWRIKSANWLGRPGVPVTGVCELPFWSRHMPCLAPFVHMQWLVGSECVCVCAVQWTDSSHPGLRTKDRQFLGRL
jgi:hypothetical protein